MSERASQQSGRSPCVNKKRKGSWIADLVLGNGTATVVDDGGAGRLKEAACEQTDLGVASFQGRLFFFFGPTPWSMTRPAGADDTGLDEVETVAVEA